MTIVEGFSIFGSIASALAIGASLWIFWRQRVNELRRLKNDRHNELLALKKIITLNCEAIKHSIIENRKIIDVIHSKKYASVSIQKIGEYFFIVFKDGYDEDKKEYYWKTYCRFYFINKFLERELLTLAKHDQNIITSFMEVTKTIDDTNNTIESLINDFVNSNYKMLKVRSNTVETYLKTLELKVDNLMTELSLI